MTCENCDLTNYKPGKVIRTTSDHNHCAVCGSELVIKRNFVDNNATIENLKWDTYFHSICVAVASKSPCLSRKIGAILVKDHSIVSTGFNGPSRGIPHCGH